MKRTLIAANWKMFKTSEEAKQFIEELKPHLAATKSDIVICPPFTALGTLKKAKRGARLKLGAQNMNEADEGAYTGEISAKMLLNEGVEYVIIGHSERRALFGETDQTVNKKLKQAILYKLLPIVCIGETLEERENLQTHQVLSDQLAIGLDGIGLEDAVKISIAYEPIWAIGTGKTPTPEQADNEIKFIRKKLSQMFSKTVARKMRIVYGGSVKAANFAAFMSMNNIDGGLIGGASLSVKEFSAIINYEKN